MANSSTFTLIPEPSGGQPIKIMDAADGPTSQGRPVVIGIYGIPGSGKTFLRRRLESLLGQAHFLFLEGSKVISQLVPGASLEAFLALTDDEKHYYRQAAIRTTAAECAAKNKTGVVMGHLMFWPEGRVEPEAVYTPADMETYTHIIYLDTPSATICKRCATDTERARDVPSIHHVQKWKDAEKSTLRELCLRHNILFTSVSSGPDTLVDRVVKLIHDFRIHTEVVNTSRIEARLDHGLAVSCDVRQLQKVLVLDADRTLIAEDTGKMIFQKIASEKQGSLTPSDPLKTIFASPLGYSYAAFRQAAFVYEEAAEDGNFDALCWKLAAELTIHPDILSLLQQASSKDHVASIVVTCGLSRIWEKILDIHGLRTSVILIAGGLLSDGFIVNASAKATIISRLQNKYGAYVWAFGDSVLDLPMLRNADEAVVMVGEKGTRSNRMDSELLDAIGDGLRARQILLPRHSDPRLDSSKLPEVQLDEPFIQHILSSCNVPLAQRLRDATLDRASKLLTTPMRDARISGPALRCAHGKAGEYLATRFLADMFETEEYPIQHVQDRPTSGHRLRNESEILIAALMRGGEPMAYGVNEVFPNAMFMHPFEPTDLAPKHLLGRHAIFLVDSVINSGKSVVEFVQHIRWINADIRIVIIAGVVQEKALSEGRLARLLSVDPDLQLVFLRKSENKFVGRGGTDTGNRLFNTTAFD